MPGPRKESPDDGLRQIGAYEILVALGSGGMATVYLAQKEVVEGVTREFAVKLMHRHLRGDPEWATHLLHEAKIAARIRHPNVVDMIEVGDDPQGMFLVLEYVEGETLSGLSRVLHRRNQRLPLSISGAILLDALLGLHAVHELRDAQGNPFEMVHRDFSPQNILVGVDGVSRLTDFGIAKVSGGQATATGVLKGKLAYMSPEQARGRRVDRRCDVWAAGVIAWELLAGRRLYTSRNEADVLLAVVSAPPPSLISVAPNVTKELNDIVAAALSFDAATRCPDANTLRERLAPAWKAAHGVAVREELARFVADAVGEELRNRRQRVAAVLEQRSMSFKPGTLVGSDSGRSGDSLVVEPPESPDTTAFHAVTTEQKRRRFAYRAGGLALGALLVGGGVLATLSRRETPAPIATPAPASEAPKPAPEAPPPSGTLIVESNENLTRVRIGRRNVELAAPAKRAEVALLPDEFGKALSLECSADSGATVRAEVGANEGSVRVEFAPRPTPSSAPPKRWPKSSKPPSKESSGDVLAPTPFKPK